MSTTTNHSSRVFFTLFVVIEVVCDVSSGSFSQTMPKPEVSLIAKSKRSCMISLDGYSGRSS